MRKLFFVFVCLSVSILFIQCSSESPALQVENSDAIKETAAKVTFHQFDPSTGTSVLIDESIEERLKGPMGCENLTVNANLVQEEDENGCCKYIVDVYSSSGQDVQVFLDGVLIASGPALGHSYPVQVCSESKTFEVYSNGALCYSKELKCGVSCCEEIEITVDDFVDSNGCCAYRVTFHEPNPCAPIAYNDVVSGDPNVTWQVIDGDVVASFTICNSGDTVELYILEGPVPSTVCQYFLFGHNYCIP